MEEPNYLHECTGGGVEEAKAGKFDVLDETTGQPKTVEMVNRIIVTHGRKKSTLNGKQVKMLVEVYQRSDRFRDWVDQCV